MGGCAPVPRHAQPTRPGLDASAWKRATRDLCISPFFCSSVQTLQCCYRAAFPANQQVQKSSLPTAFVYRTISTRPAHARTRAPHSTRTQKKNPRTRNRTGPDHTGRADPYWPCILADISALSSWKRSPTRCCEDICFWTQRARQPDSRLERDLEVKSSTHELKQVSTRLL